MKRLKTFLQILKSVEVLGNIPKPKHVRIGPRTIDCIFTGYANNSIAYLVRNSEIPDMQEGIITKSKNVAFSKDIFIVN